MTEYQVIKDTEAYLQLLEEKLAPYANFLSEPSRACYTAVYLSKLLRAELEKARPGF
jgi:hypothetical protein